MIRVRDTFKSYDEYRDFYMNSTGYDLSQDAITEDDRKGIPAYPRWEYGLKWIKELGQEEVMDIGSWTGRWPIILGANNIHCLAVEANKAAYDYMDYYPKINSMIEDFVTEPYEVITAFEIIEHIYDMDEFLEKVKSFLVPNGYFIFSTPNQDGAYAGEDNDIHLWTATLPSLMETFKDWEIIDYEVGDLIMMVVQKKG